MTLCLSLHSAIPEKRLQIMPVEKGYPLEHTIQAMRTYGEKTGRRIIYEYIMLADFNLGEEDADALAQLLRGQILPRKFNSAQWKCGTFSGSYSARNTKF